MSQNNADNTGINNFSGGLNTVSTVDVMPRGDTPVCVNVEITDEGTARTRRGTRLNAIINNFNERRGCDVFAYNTRGGNAILFVKTGYNLEVYALEYKNNDVYSTLAFTKDNIWDDEGSNAKASFVVTYNRHTRIFITTGVNPPVVITIVESNRRYNDTYMNSFEFRLPGLRWADDTNSIAWCQGTFQRVSGVSDNGDDSVEVNLENSFDLDNFQPNNDGVIEFDFAFITWQWGCQALLLTGNDMYESVTRFNAVDTDRTVAIPVSLLNNIRKNNAAYPIIPYVTNVPGQYYTYNPKPTLSNEFSFSAGIYYDPASSGVHVPNFTHLSFGALEASGEPREISLVRAIPLDFTDENGSLSNNGLVALVNNEIKTIGDNTGAADFYLRQDLPVGFYSDSSINLNGFSFITADATNNFGLAGSDIVEILYTIPRHLGFGATSSYYDEPRDGAPIALYGIQEHANYSRRSYPSVVNSFQSRLVFAGFSNELYTVVLSETANLNLAGNSFQNFSVAWSNFSASDPISVSIKNIEDNVTALQESNNNLIVFTIRSVYRIFSNDGPLRPTNVVLARLGGLGCVNSRSAVKIDNAVYFLSLSGIVRLAPAVQVGSFNLTLFSEKINNRTKSILNAEFAYISYDRVKDYLYIAVCTGNFDVADVMFVMNVRRQAAFEYTHFTQSWLTFGMANVFIANQSFMMFLVGLPFCADAFLLSHPHPYNLDFSTEEPYEAETPGDGYGSSSSFDVVDRYFPYVETTITVEARQTEPLYEINEFLNSPLQHLPVHKILFDDNPLVFGVDWFSFGFNKYLINAAFTVGNDFTIFPVDDRNEYPLRVYVNDIEYTEYTISNFSGCLRQLDFDNLDSDDRVRVGLTIPYAISTPRYALDNIVGETWSNSIAILLSNKDFHRVNPRRTWLTKVGFSVSKQRELDQSYFIDRDALGTTGDARYDDSAYDFATTREQFKAISKVVASPKGASDLVQIFIHTFSDFGFEIMNFQFLGGRSRRKS